MRCIVCGELSWHVLCSTCKEQIEPRLNKREIQKNFFVYSFYSYDDISPFLYTKHQNIGNYIFDFLAQKAFGRFFDALRVDDSFNIVPIDDRVKNGYSHTAVLANAIKSKNIIPNYGALRANNSVDYGGKSLAYRKANPRDFTCKLKNLDNIVLIDDVVTTGTTLLEALHVMKKSNINVLFALTLADAKVK